MDMKANDLQLGSAGAILDKGKSMRNNNVFAKGAGITADFVGPAFTIAGGTYVMGFFGTLGGGTLKVQYSPDDPAGNTWVDLGQQNGVNTQLASVGTSVMRLPPGRFRVTLGGSAGANAGYWFGECNESS